jgi:hypothetical protein
MDRHDTPAASVTWSARLYRALLLAYPAPFRREYGDEMTRTFRDLCRDAWRAGGARNVFALWPRAARDLLLAASAERLGELNMLRLTLILSLATPAVFVLDTFLSYTSLLDVAIYGFIGWLGLAVAAWLVGAAAAALRGRWGWFALALCLPYVGSLIYSVLETPTPPSAARV